MKDILIYADEGAGPRATRFLNLSLVEEGVHERYCIRKINRFDLRTDHWWQNTALLVFPGGRSKPYHEALTGQSNSLIRAWVEAGGTYLGFCGGAYYGCAKVEFEIGTPLEIICSHELGFYPGIARGPAYGVGQFRYLHESGARLASLTGCKGGSSYSSYYNGGCAFIDPENYAQVKVLARYADIQDTPAAIVECRVGKGKAVLCGVHPEFAPHFLEKSDPHLSGLRQRLEKLDAQRRALYQEILAAVLP